MSIMYGQGKLSDARFFLWCYKHDTLSQMRQNESFVVRLPLCRASQRFMFLRSIHVPYRLSSAISFAGLYLDTRRRKAMYENKQNNKLLWVIAAMVAYMFGNLVGSNIKAYYFTPTSTEPGPTPVVYQMSPADSQRILAEIDEIQYVAKSLADEFPTDAMLRWYDGVNIRLQNIECELDETECN